MTYTKVALALCVGCFLASVVLGALSLWRPALALMAVPGLFAVLLLDTALRSSRTP